MDQVHGPRSQGVGRTVWLSARLCDCLGTDVTNSLLLNTGEWCVSCPCHVGAEVVQKCASRVMTCVDDAQKVGDASKDVTDPTI